MTERSDVHGEVTVVPVVEDFSDLTRVLLLTILCTDSSISSFFSFLNEECRRGYWKQFWGVDAVVVLFVVDELMTATRPV
jgi:hypothetical protein